MDEANQSAEWERSSALMCLVANAVRGKRRPFKTHEFNPYAEAPRSAPGAFNRLGGFFKSVVESRKRQS